MENVVHVLAALLTIFQVADVASMKGKPLPLLRADQTLDLVQVTLMAGGKVVQSDYRLIELEQGFQQVGADKTSNASNQPGLWAALQLFLYYVVFHCCSTYL